MIWPCYESPDTKVGAHLSINLAFAFNSTCDDGDDDESHVVPYLYYILICIIFIQHLYIQGDTSLRF